MTSDDRRWLELARGEAEECCSHPGCDCRLTYAQARHQERIDAREYDRIEEERARFREDERADAEQYLREAAAADDHSSDRDPGGEW